MIYQADADLVYRMDVKDPDSFCFEMGKYRPPNEGQDLSL